MRIRELQVASTSSSDNAISDNISMISSVLELQPTPLPSTEFCTLEQAHSSDAELSMICSSSSKSRGSNNWLSRLRAAKGFPVDPDLSIDHFLTSQIPSEEAGSFISSPQLENGASTDACKESGDRCNRFSESPSSQTVVFDIPNTVRCSESISCKNRGDIKLGSQSSLVASSKTSETSSEAGKASSSHIPSLSSNKIEDEGMNKCIQLPLCKDTTQLYLDMLSELFCMESCSSNSEAMKKRPRKQGNPKNCNIFPDLEPSCTAITSVDVPMEESNKNSSREIVSENPPTLLSAAATLEKVDIRSSSQGAMAADYALCQQKSSKKESVGFKRRKYNCDNDVILENQVYLIDTSVPGWKVEKLITRRGNSWKVQNKEASISREGSLGKPMKVPKRRARTMEDRNTMEQNCLDNLQLQCESGTSCREQCQTDTRESIIFDRAWGTAPQTQMRSRRKPRKNVPVEDEPAQDVQNFTNSRCAEQPKTLALDHPANQPKEGLLYSIYKVFMQAGKSGLTAREAVSRILDQGLPGLHEGGVAPRVEVLKIVSNSPYFMPLEESKYILCSALVGDEDQSHGEKQNVQVTIEKVDEENTDMCLPETSKPAKQHGISQYWAACAAIQRARTGKPRRKPSLGSCFVNPSSNQELQEAKVLSHNRRLKSMKQDTTGLGNQCNRSDGKGWHCPLRAKVGYLLCDHHLDRLRTRVKSHIKSKVMSMTRTGKDDCKRILGGSWVVKKVVERSRIGRHVPVGLNQYRQVTSEGMFDNEAAV